MNERGFTLAELLITIGLISVLCGIAFFSSRDLMRGYQIKGAARQVISDMQFARLNAIREGKQWSVCVSPDNSFTSYNIQNGAGANAKTVDLASMFSNMAFSENLASSACFRFNGNGTASSGAVTVKAVGSVAGDQSVEITVNSSTGNIRAENKRVE